MKITLLPAISGLSLLLFTTATSAATLTYNAYWQAGGGVTSGTAATCYYNYPTLQPLSQPRTLIVDNHLPNGTVIYSWDYASFAPNFSGSCEYVSSSNVYLGTASLANFRIYFDGITPGVDNYKTSIPGIELRFYYTVHSKGSDANSSVLTTEIQGGSTMNPPMGVEYQLTSTYGPAVLGPFFRPVQEKGTFNTYYKGSANNFNLSLRGELVKVSDVSYTASPLTLPAASRLRYQPTVSGNSPGTTDLTPSILGGGGIKIMSPSCRLTSPSDYEIDLGRWAQVGPGSSASEVALPAYGAIKPINLKLECSGQLDNVQFSFQDAGASPLSNNNVSVYDSIGGTKIDGLEIEMSYGGIPFKVNKLSDATTSFIKTNTGAQGTMKTNPSDMSFNSQATVQFGASFVQRSAITRSGSSYTGPVTGRVNMFVTYN